MNSKVRSADPYAKILLILRFLSRLVSLDTVESISLPTKHQIALPRALNPSIHSSRRSDHFHSSLVAFGPRQRAIGEAAKTQETSNFANTIGQLKRIVGRTLNDPEIQNVEKKFMNNTLVDVDGSVGVEVSFCILPSDEDPGQMVWHRREARRSKHGSLAYINSPL